ncbi:LOW QUALITY PROTEIN: uncharacterized protein [Procambarus clarkii]|uniref:LOW QUALITY PROTEIN: uncharacterized protein n=1 Tax=Procambarus clarkii TaxID=6728 RepID=UPI003742D7B5
MCRKRGRLGLAALLGILLCFSRYKTLATVVPEHDASYLPQLPSIQDLMAMVPDRPFHTLADVDAFTATLQDLADFHLDKSFTAETRRYRRALDMTSVNITDTALYSFNYFNPSEFNAGSLEGVSGQYLLTTPEKYFWVLGNQRSGWQSVIEMSRPDYKIKLLAKFQLGESFEKMDKIVAEITSGLLWMALGCTSSSVVTIVCMNISNGRYIITQEITTEGGLGALHMFQVNDKLHLVIGELASHVEARLYELVDNYFDHRDDVQFHVKGVQDISGFRDEETFYYIVFGMESPDGGLEVYQMDLQDETITLAQLLPDDGLKIVPFLDPHDDRNYVLSIGKSALPKIYKWSNQQLREWQALEPGHGSCCSAGVLTLDNLENLIFIGQGGKIRFYSDDMTGHYYPSFVVDTDCSTISELQGMTLMHDYIVSYICIGVDGTSKLQARILSLKHVKLAELLTTADDLLRCLDEVDTLLETRQTNITLLQELMSSGSLKTVDGAQNWTGLVTFSKGLTVMGTTTFTSKVDVNPSGSIVPTGQLAQLFSDVEQIKTSMLELTQEIGKVLYHSGDQTIIGPITASTMTFDKMAIDTLQTRKVNGVTLTDFGKVFMINGLDQTISMSFNMGLLTVDSFTTRGRTLLGTINGIRTDEYMRLSLATQSVTGDHRYASIISGDITAREGGSNTLLINGINSTTIVTKGASLAFHDPKIFDNLIVQGPINAGLVNDVDLTGLENRVVYTNIKSEQTVRGVYSVASMQVDGNVDVGTVNGLNLRELDAAVVKTTGDFTLQGAVTYSESLSVTGDVSVPIINGIKWGDILDLDSPNLVSSNYYFANAVVTDAIRSNNINGLDLSQDAVLVDTQQTITGGITFMGDVKVTGAAGVVIDQGATVNGVDPHQLNTTIDALTHVVINQEVHLTAPLKCSGDVVAHSINGLLLEGLGDRYWRRAKDQNVSVGLYVRQAEFRGPVTGLSINNRKMSDYLHTSGSRYITGQYVFKGPVMVEGALETRPDATVDGLHLSELEANAVRLHGDQIITGITNFNGRLTVGDVLLSGLLNDLNVSSDIMMLDRSLPHTGNLVFNNNIVATTITLSGNLMTDTINGLDVKTAASQLVLVDQETTIKGDLQFTGAVNVYSLVAANVDDVNLSDLAKRSLKKSSSVTQMVTGRIKVRNVHFSQEPSLGLVNMKDWTTHLSNVVPHNYNGSVTGVKVFLKPLDIKGNFDLVTINGLRINDLAALILTKSTVQTIAAHYTFSTSINATGVMANIIDGISASDLVLIDTVSQVGGSVTFGEEVTFLGGLNSTTGTLDGCDILKANAYAIWKVENGSFNLPFPATIGSLYITGSATSSGTVIAAPLNMDVTHFLSTLVSTSSNQEITGPVEFLRDIEIGNLGVVTIDGVDVDELFRVSVLNNVDAVISCKLDFRKPVSVSHLKVTETLSGIGDGGGVLVNGINVAATAARVVLATGGTFVVTGRKTFARGLVTNHLIVTGSLGGIGVKDLVVISAGVVLKNLVFTSTVNIGGNLWVSGLIDGVDLTQVLANRTPLDHNQTLSGTWRFEAIKVEGDLEVAQINDVVVSDLVVKHGMTSQEVYGAKILTGGLVVKGDIQTGLVNGFDIERLNSTIVRRDDDVTITGVVEFEYIVRVMKSLVVLKTVNAYDLSTLSYNLSPLKKIIDQQFQRIDKLRLLLSSIEVASLVKEKRLQLGYLEKIKFQNLKEYGRLWFGLDYTLGPESYISIKSRSGPCICCSPLTSFYQVNAGGVARNATQVRTGSVFILRHPSLSLQITLTRQCTEGVPSTIAVDDTSRHPVNLFTTTAHLGLVTDSAMFVDNGVAYIVTVTGTDKDSNGTAGNVVTASMVDLTNRRVVEVWTRPTRYAASGLDLDLVHGNWYLLLANYMDTDNVVDPYTAASQLYMWNNTAKMFQLKGEYVGDLVSSGIFVKIKLPVEVYYFSLAQSKAADYPLYDDNVKYTTKVLIFKYNEEIENFVEFECLPAYGVVDQTTLTVDLTLYLLLLSEKGLLSVYEYRHPEGFRVFQTLSIENGYALAIMEMSGGTFVAVSVSSPPGVLLLRVNIKGIKPFKLLE